jgi:O-antigen/teichoic acid export membrane protein
MSAPPTAEPSTAGFSRSPSGAWRARLGSPVAASLAGKVAESLTQLLLISLVPAVLGPSDYGVFALALGALMIASTFVRLGGPALLTRYVPAAPPAERPALARALGARIAAWRMIQVALLAVAATVLAIAAPERFPPLLTALVVLAIALDVIATLAFQIGLAFGHARLWSFRYPLQNSALILAAIALYELAGRPGAVAGIAVASGTALALGAAAALRHVADAPRGAPLPVGATRFGVMQGASGVLAQLQERGAVVAVALLSHSSAEAGFAALATGVALTPTYAVRQTFTVQLPALAERASQSLDAAEAIGRRLARNWSLVLLPVALAAALSFDSLLPAILGEDFGGAEDALPPALAAIPLAAVIALGNQISALRLEPQARLVATAVGTVAFVVIAALAIPAWDAAGGTSALLGATLATVLVSGVLLPGMMDRTLVALSVGGAALVLAVGVLM